MGYLATWSGVNAYRKTTGRDPLVDVGVALRDVWGSAERRRASWPLALRAGRIGRTAHGGQG